MTRPSAEGEDHPDDEPPRYVRIGNAHAIMLRAKEREPAEGDDSARTSARRDGEALKVGQGDPDT